jgi:hypothetical protein
MSSPLFALPLTPFFSLLPPLFTHLDVKALLEDLVAGASEGGRDDLLGDHLSTNGRDKKEDKGLGFGRRDKD